jgi:hypothetical protein
MTASPPPDCISPTNSSGKQSPEFVKIVAQSKGSSDGDKKPVTITDTTPNPTVSSATATTNAPDPDRIVMGPNTYADCIGFPQNLL